MAPGKHQKDKGKNDSAVTGSSKINKKIRDIERLLQKRRDTLPANIIVDKERELAALKVEKENITYVQKVKTLSKKYHMIRFFEKKKALRKYKQIKSEYDELVADESAAKKDIKKLRKKLQHAEVDLAYVVNFPKDTKYIALYPSEESTQATTDDVKKGLQKTEEQRTEFKKQIEKMIKEEKLPITIEQILAGNTSTKVTHNTAGETVAPDAPQAKEEDDEDEFFD